MPARVAVPGWLEQRSLRHRRQHAPRAATAFAAAGAVQARQASSDSRSLSASVCAAAKSRSPE